MRKFTKFFLSLLAMLMVTASANAWKFTSVTPAAGEVESISSISVAWEGDGWLYEMGAVQCTVTGPDGASYTFNLSNQSPNEVSGSEASFKTLSDPGTYTLAIPAGAFHYMDANWNPTEANEAQTFTWTIKGSDDQGGGTQGGGTQGGGGSQTTGWSFTNVTPAEGVVDDLSTIVLEMPQSVGGANESANLNIVDQNGTTYKYYLYDNYGGAIHANYVGEEGNEPSKAGTYTLTIPAATFSSYMDGATNAEMTYTWTIAGAEPEASPYTLTYDKDNELLKLVKDGATSYDVTNAGGATLEGYDGYFSFNPADPEWTFMGNTCIAAYVNLAPGDYILHVQANTYLFDGVANEAFDIPFTVSGGTQGGGNHEFSGTPYHETIFKAGETTVDKNNIGFDTDGVTLTTEGYTSVQYDFYGNPIENTVKVGYNTYDEKELDWNINTKLIFTAKKDINKIILIPTASGKNAMQYASANGGDGEYNNGVWEGKLAAGETLTLTQNDGTQIKEIYICYNGDDFDPTSQADEKGVITIQYPVENQLIEKQVDGGKFCTFTTNKEYAYVTIQVVNSNPVYDNLDGFPVRMVDNMGENSDNLHVGENTIYAATPASGSAGKGDDWYWFKDDSYTMIVKGFVNPWDNEYDAIAEVHFVGNGKEHVAESTTKLINVTPASGSQIAMVNGVVTLEFDGPVSSVTAITPGGMSDPTINHTATAKAGSDNKVWEINLGDRSGQASADTDGNPTLEVDVTATAADGIVLLSDTRADRGLELKYELVAGAGPAPVITLGTPTWSVAEGAEIEASTSSINFKFPQVGDLYATYTFEVSGTIADKQMNISIVNGTGTVASGADINVTLAEDVAYNLQIGTITIKDGETVIYSTESGNYQLNFATKAAQGGNDGEIEVTGDKNGATFTFVNESDVALSWNEPVTVNGTASDRFDLGMEWNEIVFSPAEPLADGKYDVVFTASSLIFDSQNENATDIKVTFYVVDGNITMTAPEPEKPTSVVLYEKDVNPEVAASKEGDSQRDLVIEGTDVTLTISNTSTSSMGKWINNAYIDNNRGGIVTTNTNVMKFTSSRTIEKIEFTANKTITQKTGTSCVGTFADNVWTGEASEISIAIGENVTNISKIVVYFAGAQAEAQMLITDAKWGTFIAPFDAELPEGVEAYTVTGVGENGVLALEPQESIKAHTPVVVYSENPVSETLKGTVTEKKTGIQNVGLLYGVYEETDAPAEIGYVLQNQPEKGVAFYKVPSTAAIQKVAPNRCYLVYGSSNARAAYFFTEEDATAINGINADALGAEGIYNASGVRVNSLQKGLNIIKTANGTKKVMIK